MAGIAVPGAVRVAALLLLSPAPLWAGGLWLYEMGTADMGTASAGRAALAQDAATAFGNPAGMTRLDRPELLAGAQLLVSQSEFETGPATTTAGARGTSAASCPEAISSTYIPWARTGGSASTSAATSGSPRSTIRTPGRDGITRRRSSSSRRG